MPFTMPIVQQCRMCIWCFDGMFFEIWLTLSTILCCIFGIVQLHIWHCTLSIIIIFLDHHIHLHHCHYRHFHHHYHHNFKQKLNFHRIILLANTINIIIIPPITISSSSLPSSSSTPLLLQSDIWRVHYVACFAIIMIAYHLYHHNHRHHYYFNHCNHHHHYHFNHY